MGERDLLVPITSLPEFPNCSSPEVIAIIYSMGPNIPMEEAKIIDVKCRKNYQCPIKKCRYQNLTSL